MIRLLNAASSAGVRVSDLPTTGITLTRGDNRRMSSMSSSRRLSRLEGNCSVSSVAPIESHEDSRVTGRSDEVEKDVDSVVTESWVTLDTTFFGENIVVLTFEVSGDLGEAVQRSTTQHI